MPTTQWKKSSTKISLFVELDRYPCKRASVRIADVVCRQVGGSRESLAFCCLRVSFGSALPKNHSALFP